jgi:hypothetical protein
MSLKGKPVVVETTNVNPAEEVAKTFQPGTTYVQYVATYADAKGTVLDITPNRTDWLADDAVILNQRQAVGLYVEAAKTQAFLGFTTTTPELGHIHDRAFQVSATEAVREWIGQNCHIGGKTQVAFFRAMDTASRKVAKARKRAFAAAFKAELAEI